MTTQDKTMQNVKCQRLKSSGLTLKRGHCAAADYQLLCTSCFPDLRHETASAAQLLHEFDCFLITTYFIVVDSMCDRMHASHSLCLQATHNVRIFVQCLPSPSWFVRGM